jgi:hypothetical protein
VGDITLQLSNLVIVRLNSINQNQNLSLKKKQVGMLTTGLATGVLPWHCFTYSGTHTFKVKVIRESGVGNHAIPLSRFDRLVI